MIDKKDFYHGAAIVELLEDHRCQHLSKFDIGYQVNRDSFAYLKYTTKSGTPWRFTFTNDELKRLEELANNHSRVVIVLICGGDGVCAITLPELAEIGGLTAGWVSVRRKFKERYAVGGQLSGLDKKIPLQRWPIIILEENIE